MVSKQYGFAAKGLGQFIFDKLQRLVKQSIAILHPIKTIAFTRLVDTDMVIIIQAAFHGVPASFGYFAPQNRNDKAKITMDIHLIVQAVMIGRD